MSESPTKDPPDYDAEAFYGVFTMLLHEYPDKSLGELWQLIDWPAIRYHGETSLDFHARIDDLRLSREMMP